MKSTKTNKTARPQPFKVGDWVTTDFEAEHKNVARQVTSIEYHPTCQSHWMITLSGGEACPTCGHPAVPALDREIDSSWAKKTRIRS